ncbi:MAG: hypothetical protein ACYTGG_11860, partial [Planctomycetota bacterium]
MALFTKSKTPERIDVPRTDESVSASGPTDAGEAIPPADPALERSTRELGGAFLDRARRNRAGILSA